MSYERIDNSPQFDGKCRDSHEARYRIAAGYAVPNNFVLDAGCGVGYGMDILCEHLYLGIDKNPPKGMRFKKADFETGEGLENLPDFDVFVGLEIIEHLNDEGVNNFINLAHKAKKWIVVSTPIVPNSNPFHKQKFTEERILEEFKWSTWRHYQTFYQDKERYGIFIFKHV